MDNKSLKAFLSYGMLIAAFCLLMLNSIAIGASEEFYQKIRVDVPNKDAAREILSSGIANDGVTYDFENGYLYLELSGYDINKIEQLGYSYVVEIPDLEAWYAARNDGLDMGGFRTYSEAVSFMNNLHSQYPSITKMENIGAGHNGNIIWAMKVSDNVNVEEDEPEVLYTGLTHAREPISMEVCLDFVNWLCTEYGYDPDATDIVDNRQVWIIPIINPDGYEYNRQTNPNGGGMWRKNRRNNGGSYGVDNNRNYTFMWGYDNSGSSPWPSDETYRGPSAGSEPENQAVMNFCEDHEFVIALHYHSYGEWFIYPYGFDGSDTPDHDLFVALADAAADINGYTPGKAPELLYPVNGDAVDWSYGEQETKPKTFGFTPEVGNSFWPYESQIPGLIAENHGVNVLFAQVAGNPYAVTTPYAPVVDEMGTDPDGNYTVSWQVVAGDTAIDRFELQELTGMTVITDGAEEGADNWEMNNFSITGSQHHSGSYSFYSGTGNNYIATLTSVNAIDVNQPMDLTYWIRVDTEANYDYAYAEISTDGNTWTILETYDGYHNWYQRSFSLDSYIGEQVFVRFRYVTDVWITDPGIWVDDIYPVQTFESAVTLSNNIQETYYDIYGQSEGTYFYRVRGQNDVGWGPFSATEDIEVTGGGQVCGDVDMIPDDDPIYVPPGGSFGLTGFISNPNPDPILTDVWVGVVHQGNFFELWNFSNISLNPGQSVNSHLNQSVPNYAPSGTYDYVAYCGDKPVSCDTASFQFTVTGARIPNGADDWTLEGDWGSDNVIPSEYAFSGSYPNPFNAETNITFELPQAGEVTLEIYNLMGQKLTTLVDEYKEAGKHTVTWDAADYSSGVYFYKLHAGDFISTKKMSLLK